MTKKAASTVSVFPTDPAELLALRPACPTYQADPAGYDFYQRWYAKAARVRFGGVKVGDRVSTRNGATATVTALDVRGGVTYGVALDLPVSELAKRRATATGLPVKTMYALAELNIDA